MYRPFFSLYIPPTKTETHHNYQYNSPTYIHILYLFYAPKRAPPGPRTPANQKTSHANISVIHTFTHNIFRKDQRCSDIKGLCLSITVWTLQTVYHVNIRIRSIPVYNIKLQTIGINAFLRRNMPIMAKLSHQPHPLKSYGTACCILLANTG